MNYFPERKDFYERQKSENFSWKIFILSGRGSLTVQFLLGFSLIIFFIMLFTAMTATLALSEVTQYITFASARALFLSHENKFKQEEAAQEKYKELKDIFKVFFQGTAFKIEDEGNLGLQTAYPSSNTSPYLFYGVWTFFKPKLLVVNTLWGGTEEPESYFDATIGSYLGREPTQENCDTFNQKRGQFIISNQPSSSYSFPNITPIGSDNGC